MQYSVKDEDGKRYLTSYEVALRVSRGDHGLTVGPRRAALISAYFRTDNRFEWSTLTHTAPTVS